MPDFTQLREQLQNTRAQKEQARLALFQARERIKRFQAEVARLDRIFQPQNREHAARRRRLEGLIAEANKAAEQQQAIYSRFQKVEKDTFDSFSPLSDPRKSVSALRDDYPFLLLPVRLETRFKTLPIAGGVQHQLWVRIYPDDCAIDTFEPILSEVEVSNARNYWAEIWKAGGIEEQERGAWRGLVAGHGSGRALWIVQHYQPLNVNDKPGKANGTDIILVISTENPPNAAEQAATLVYWKAVWLADGNKTQEQAALANLVAAVGEARAAEIVQQYQPRNLGQKPQPPLQKSEVAVSVAFVIFPRAEEVATKQLSWTQAPKVNIFPDRFVLLGFSAGAKVFEVIGNPVPSPLVAGPDPSAPPEEQLQQKDGEIIVSEEMKWMVDFERAVEWGLGFKINLNEAQARSGFDRLLVLGLRLSADESESKTLLETLLQHHHQGRSGFSILPQGTPTNNTESGGSGFTRTDDADASFDVFFKENDSPFNETSWLLKKDGQWLAECLGIDAAVLKSVPHSNGTDQSEARAMHTALWPATLGYMMETMMQPVFEEEDIESARWFFNNFVSGRGMIPAVRIGSQPYGILPAAAFSRLNWIFSDNWRPIAGLDHPKNYRDFLKRIYGILRVIAADWAEMAKNVSYVGKAGDAHKTLLDIIGLHPASSEFYQRYAESLQDLFNRLNLEGLGGALIEALIALGYVESGKELLRKLGYDGEQAPEVLERFFLAAQQRLKGPVIDDRPLSETELIRSYTGDGRNYIQWLVDAANTSLETIRLQQGFKDNQAPTALLYILLRHALMLGYWDTSLRLHVDAQVLPASDLKAAKREAPFVHVREQTTASESRWQYLYKTEGRITQDETLLVADFIPKILKELPAAHYLDEQITALQLLSGKPTARLERTFAEHIDCCSYRLDAWQLGLIHYQLATMRFRGVRQGATKGLYLGAYGWLEEVRPENKVLSPVRLEPELEAIFKSKDSLLLRDGTNGGYIHAPSLNHAVTAAVLRNGYLSNASPANRQTLAVNLSSERVRTALSLLEGIRGGQSLGALLGYQFERGLHDRHNFAEVDEFILKLRKAFPLRANRLSTTSTKDREDDQGITIEALEARNVLDGLSLVSHVKQPGKEKYPFSLENLPPADPAQAAAIDAEVDRLLDIHDAIADLALAEGVHQATQGNFDRAAATLDTYSKGNFPPEPAVIQTPRSGITLTHRVGLHLEPGVSHSISPVTGVAMTPRAKSEPALNKWLASILSVPENVGCRVKYFDHAANAVAEKVVTQKDLQLQPIDLLYLVRTESQQAMAELDDRVLHFVIKTYAPRPDAAISIHYTERLEDPKISFFELAPLIQSLGTLTLRSRSLRATDIVLQNDATQAQEAAVFVDRDRIAQVKTDMNEAHTPLADFAEELETLLADVATNRDQILAEVDVFIDRITALLSIIGSFGIPQAGWGFAIEFKRQTFSGILEKVRELVNRWNEKLEQFDALLDEFANLPAAATDKQRFEILQNAERLISVTLTIPLPAAPEDYKTIVLNKRGLFTSRLNLFIGILSTNTNSLATLLGEVKALLPVVDFDLVGLELSGAEDQIVSFVSDIMSRAKSVAVETNNRMIAAQAQLDIHDGSAQATARAEALQQAAKILLGEDFHIIPEFEIVPEQGEEWEKALIAGQSGELLSHLTHTDFPVDDWLYGVARVREKMRHWEQLLMVVPALGKTAPELLPMQLPFQAGDHWLGLDFAAGYQIDRDRLLYTAHYAVPFQKAQRQCGLLLDEWTEVIPANEETTGIAFNYDRPNSEPPQAMLLVTPAAFTGAWQWQDLVDALNETLEMARKRAVEPVHVDATAYARFLPATIMAVTLYQISIAANLAINNKIYDFVEGGNG